MPHETFHYRSLDQVRETARALDAFLPLQEDLSPLLAPLNIGGKTLANRMAFQPMEGTDGTEDGAPGPLTIRRYQRFAQAGPGLIWFEAVATVPEGRASAHQLYLTEKNVDAFRRLTDQIREISLRENGYAPMIIMQATNSGRYAKPTGTPAPLIAYHCPPLEDPPVPGTRVLTDEELQRYEAAFEGTARLCQQAGFDGMDVKCCHRYLACELLSAFTRPGPYGGSYENRTRFLKNAYRAAQAAAWEEAHRKRAAEKSYVEKGNKDEAFRYHIAKVVEDDDSLQDDPVLTDQDLVLGIRPEFLDIADQSPLEGEIYGAMPTGMESTIKVRVDDFLLTGVIFGSSLFTIGEKVPVTVSGDNIMLFHRKSGACIATGSLEL